MGNPFYDANNQNGMYNNAEMFRNMYRAIQQSNNPSQMFIDILGRNPQMQPVLNAMQSGVKPQDIYIEMCKQRGINPQDFLKSITG